MVPCGAALLAISYSGIGAFPSRLADFSALAIGRHYVGSRLRVFAWRSVFSGAPSTRPRASIGSLAHTKDPILLRCGSGRGFDVLPVTNSNPLGALTHDGFRIPLYVLV